MFTERTTRAACWTISVWVTRPESGMPKTHQAVIPPEISNASNPACSAIWAWIGRMPNGITVVSPDVSSRRRRVVIFSVGGTRRSSQFRSSSDLLEDGGVGHAAALAHHLQAVTYVVRPHAVGER